MSTTYRKPSIIVSAMAIALGLGMSTSLWAQSASLHPVSLQLAMMDDMKEMGGMGGGKMGGNMPSAGSMQMPSSDSANPAADPMATPSNMDMMGRMRGSMQSSRQMRNMAPTTSLPGFPGASRLYHVGATSFFLDHPQHITLSTEQQTSLNRIKEKALLDRATADRRIEEAEQQLWTLTAAASPDAAKIEAKVREIEKMRGDQRLAFIRAVGEAGKVLTADQRAAVLGTKPPAKQATGNAAPAAKPDPMPSSSGMKHN